MKTSKILWVREYGVCGKTYFDVKYRFGRVQTFAQDDLPQTVMDFILNSQVQDVQWDGVFQRAETIYQ